MTRAASDQSGSSLQGQKLGGLVAWKLKLEWLASEGIDREWGGRSITNHYFT